MLIKSKWVFTIDPKRGTCVQDLSFRVGLQVDSGGNTLSGRTENPDANRDAKA